MVYFKMTNSFEETRQYNSRYWEQCEIQFCGVVTEIDITGYGGGYVCLDLTYSNKNEDYSLYIDNEVYIYSQKKDKATFVTGNISSLKKGDSICYNFDGNRKELRYRNDSLLLEYNNAILRQSMLKEKESQSPCWEQ